MAVTSFRFPTATPVNSGAVNPDNAWADDGVYANLDGLADTFRVGSFGDFSIPAGKEIIGIEVVVNAKYTGAGLNRTLTVRVTVNGGSSFSSQKSQSVPNTTDSDMTFGGATDMWGLSGLTDANIDSNNNLHVELGLADLSVTSVDIDSVKIRFYYDDSTLELEGFRFRADDGDEDAATWLANQDVDIQREIEDITRLRLLINATNDPPARQFQLEYARVSDAFPVVSDPLVTSSAVSVTSMPVAIPKALSGELIVVGIIVRNDGTFTPPSGFSLLGSQDSGGVGSFRIYTKVADGTENGSVTFTTGTGTTYVAHGLVVRGQYASSPIEATFSTSGGTPGSDVNPPSETASWGSAKNLFIAMMATTAEVITLSAYPTNYVRGKYDSVSAGGSSVSIGTAVRDLEAASDDPGIFTTSASRWWMAATVVIRPGDDVFAPVPLYNNKIITPPNFGWEHDTTQGQFNKWVQIDSTHFVLLYQGAAGDGFAQPFEYNATYGTLTKVGTALEFDTADQLGIDAVVFNTNRIFVVWGGSGSDGFARVLTVNTSTWAVTGGTALEYDITQGLFPTCAYIRQDGSGNWQFMVCWQGASADGFARVLQVATGTETITTLGAAALEFDTSDYSYGSVHKVNNDDTRYILFHRGAAADGFVRILTVNLSTYAITATSSLEFDTANGTHNKAIPLDATHFLNVWGGGATATGKAQVFEVNTTSWAVTPLGKAFDYDATAPLWNSLCLLDYTNNEYIVALAYSDSSGLGQIEILKIRDDIWMVESMSNDYTFDRSAGNYNSLIKVSTTRLLNAWAGQDADGFVQVFDVKTPPIMLTPTSNIGGARIPWIGRTISKTTGSGDTLNHTIETGTKMLIILLGNHQGTCSAVDVSGNAATKEIGAATAFNEIAEIWFIANPTPGAVTITPTWSGGSGRQITALNVFGCKTSNPSTSQSATGSSTSPSVNITPPSNNNLVIDASYAEAAFTATGANQFQTSNLLGASYEAFHTSIEEVQTAAATTMNKTISSGQRWATVAVALEPEPENTTVQLTAPSGKSTSDFVVGKIREDQNPADAVDITTDDYTEMEWAFLATNQAQTGDIYQFRVTRLGTLLDTYSVTPDMEIIVGTTRRRNFPLWI